MLPAISSAVSGMRAATLRLEASARNVANVSSRGALPSAGAAGPQVYLLVRVDQTSLAGPGAGGGTKAAVRNVSPAWMAAYDPDASFADADGMVAAPNVDLMSETLEQVSAEISFMANVKTLQATQEMVKRLFELTDQD